MKKWFFSLFLLAGTWFMPGCGSSTEDLDANGVPHVLIVALPGGQMEGLTKQAMGPFQGYLEKELKMPVKFIYVAGTYGPIIEALKAKKVDMAYIPPFAYVLASAKMDLTPIVILGENGKPSMYNSCIFTSSKSNIRSMEDVKARAKSLTIAFPDPASTSGHLIPGGYLKSIGLDPDSSFKQMVFAGSHPAVIMSVVAGKEDIGCSMTEQGIDRLAEKGQIKKEDVRILWVSPPIISDPIVLRSDINREFILKVQKAYLEMKVKDPAAFNNYVSVMKKDKNTHDFMVAQDSMYNGLRSIAKSMHYLDGKK